MSSLLSARACSEKSRLASEGLPRVDASRDGTEQRCGAGALPTRWRQLPIRPKVCQKPWEKIRPKRRIYHWTPRRGDAAPLLGEHRGCRFLISVLLPLRCGSIPRWLLFILLRMYDRRFQVRLGNEESPVNIVGPAVQCGTPAPAFNKKAKTTAESPSEPRSSA